MCYLIPPHPHDTIMSSAPALSSEISDKEKVLALLEDHCSFLRTIYLGHIADHLGSGLESQEALEAKHHLKLTSNLIFILEHPEVIQKISEGEVVGTIVDAMVKFKVFPEDPLPSEYAGISNNVSFWESII